MKKLTLVTLFLTAFFNTTVNATEIIIEKSGKRVVIKNDKLTCYQMEILADKAGYKLVSCDPNGSIAPNGKKDIVYAQMQYKATKIEKQETLKLIQLFSNNNKMKVVLLEKYQKPNLKLKTEKLSVKTNTIKIKL